MIKSCLRRILFAADSIMQHVLHAILAFALTFAAGAAHAPQPPIEVRFLTADGLRISGVLTSWDEEGIDGSFGQRPWNTLDHRDVWRLYRRLMEDTNPAHWLRLGRTLLLMSHAQPDAARYADQALARAKRLNPAAEQAIQAIREEAAEIAKASHAAEQQKKQSSPNTQSPEAGPQGGWQASPWPELTEAEQHAATLTMKADLQSLIEQADLALGIIETRHFVIASDLDRADIVRLALLLDRTHAIMLELLGLPAETRLFWGKAAALIVKDAARYRRLSLASFGFAAPPEPMGLLHPIGPKVFLLMHAEGDIEELEWQLAQQAALGVLHRHVSPMRLPVWANEGLAERVVAVAVGDSHIARERRRVAQAMIRNTTDLMPLFLTQYTDENWYTKADAVRLTGALVVEMMIRARPDHFRAWVRAAKGGASWSEALETRYGTTRKDLAEISLQYWRVND